jgi:hypothetical protein
MSQLLRPPLGAASFLFAVCFFLPCPRCEAQQWARDMFAVTSHDFGVVPRDAEVAFTFEFKNKYKETVHVSAVRSTCGCTIPSVVEDTVASRETSGIVATFNTKAFTGTRAAKITVQFDRPYFAEVELLVQGTILGDVSFEPDRVAFGQVASGSEPTQSVQVRFLNRPSIRIRDVRSVCSDLGVSLSEPRREGNTLSYDLKVRLKESLPPGSLKTELTIVTSDPSLTNIPIPVEASVRAPLDVKPASLHFGPHAPGESDAKRITLRADAPFQVTEVRCPDDRFSFEVLNDGASKFHFVKISFAADAEQTGTFKFPLEIATDLGGGQTSSCLITGEVSAE